MPEAITRPAVNGILESSLHVESVARSAEFYQRVFGFEVIGFDEEKLTGQSRICALRAGDRSVLLLLKKGGTPGLDASGSVHIAFAIGRSDLPAWEQWLAKQGIAIERRRTWKDGGQALFFRDPDRHLLEVVTPGVWSIY